MSLLEPPRRRADVRRGWQDRYSDHLRLPEIDAAGQLSLLQTKVLIVGAGGLSSSCALALASAGIGTLAIVDCDTSGRHSPRQGLKLVDRLDKLRIDSAAISIEAVTHDTHVLCHPAPLDASNVADTVGRYDVVVDGVDNFSARYLLNDAAARRGVPVVSAAVFEFEGYLSVLTPPVGPCYRCLYPVPPPPERSPSYPVFAALPAVMGALQAIEVVKLVLGSGRSLIGRLLVYDALRATLTELKVAADISCPACSRLRGEERPEYSPAERGSGHVQAQRRV